MSTVLRHVVDVFSTVFAFCCNPLSPRRRLTTRIWLAVLVMFTICTTVLMLICVCTDSWELIEFDVSKLNRSILDKGVQERSPTDDSSELTCSRTDQLYFDDGVALVRSETSAGAEVKNGPSSTTVEPKKQSACNGRWQMTNASLAFRFYGSAFRLCMDVSDATWANLTRLCQSNTLDKCLYYTADSVKQPFCCMRCLYNDDEVDELDENGSTTFEPIFTVIGFLVVCLVILCVCHLLAFVAVWKRIVPVVMFTGILFLVSGTFMAFCLAAHQYKIKVMETKLRILPHVTTEMALARTTSTGYSVDVGWMAFAFSVLTGILWIRFSYHLASETTYNKIRPTVTVIHSNTTTNVMPIHGNNSTGRTSTDGAGRPSSTVANGNAFSTSTNSINVPKTVRWATVNPGRDTSSTVVPSRPNSGSNLLNNEYGPATNGGAVQHNGGVGLPVMVEDAV